MPFRGCSLLAYVIAIPAGDRGAQVFATVMVQRAKHAASAQNRLNRGWRYLIQHRADALSNLLPRNAFVTQLMIIQPFLPKIPASR
jgi:hypothetical protein